LFLIQLLIGVLAWIQKTIGFSMGISRAQQTLYPDRQ